MFPNPRASKLAAARNPRAVARRAALSTAALRKSAVVNSSAKLAAARNPRAVARRAAPKVSPFQPVSPGGAFRTQPGRRTMANPAIRRGARR